MFCNKSTHAYSIINVVFRVSFYGYTICVTNLELWYVWFQVCTCILRDPNSPTACSPCCTSKMYFPCLCLFCNDYYGKLVSLGYVYDMSNLFKDKSIQCNSANGVNCTQKPLLIFHKKWFLARWCVTWLFYASHDSLSLGTHSTMSEISGFDYVNKNDYSSCFISLNFF